MIVDVRITDSVGVEYALTLKEWNPRWCRLGESEPEELRLRYEEALELLKSAERASSSASLWLRDSELAGRNDLYRIPQPRLLEILARRIEQGEIRVYRIERQNTLDWYVPPAGPSLAEMFAAMEAEEAAETVAERSVLITGASASVDQVEVGGTVTFRVSGYRRTNDEGGGAVEPLASEEARVSWRLTADGETIREEREYGPTLVHEADEAHDGKRLVAMPFMNAPTESVSATVQVGERPAVQLDAISLQRIARLHPDVQDAARELLRHAADEGILLRVTQGLRTWEEQERLFAQGRTAPGAIVTRARAGQSYHNFGLAFDVVPMVDGVPDWNGPWVRIGEIGKSLGFEWGGDWTRIEDKPHFQMTFGHSTDELQQMYESGQWPVR